MEDTEPSSSAVCQSLMLSSDLMICWTFLHAGIRQNRRSRLVMFSQMLKDWLALVRLLGGQRKQMRQDVDDKLPGIMFIHCKMCSACLRQKSMRSIVAILRSTQHKRCQLARSMSLPATTSHRQLWNLPCSTACPETRPCPCVSAYYVPNQWRKSSYQTISKLSKTSCVIWSRAFCSGDKLNTLIGKCVSFQNGGCCMNLEKWQGFSHHSRIMELQQGISVQGRLTFGLAGRSFVIVDSWPFANQTMCQMS